MTDQDVCPIIYVRGFAGGTSGIDSATGDPFYGLNAGTTHVRIDGNGNPQFYQFEGPLVRLIEDEDYRIVVHGGQQAYLASVGDRTQPRNSVWIYRFYDPAADSSASRRFPTISQQLRVVCCLWSISYGLRPARRKSGW